MLHHDPRASVATPAGGAPDLTLAVTLAEREVIGNLLIVDPLKPWTMDTWTRAMGMGSRAAPDQAQTRARGSGA